MRIVTNSCYDYLRQIQRRPSSSLEDVAVDPEYATRMTDRAEAPDDYALRQELGKLIQEGIATLPIEQRTVLVLSDIEGLSYEEIAQAMDTSLGTVKSRLSRARGKLRDYLQERQELLPGRYRLEND